MLGLGRLFNVVHEASGVHIPMKDAGAVTFVGFLAAGTQTFTVKKSVDGASEVALDATFYPYKAPGIGGTWTAMAEQDDTVTNNDATNDMLCITVHAIQLNQNPADANHGLYNCVEVTADTGTCIAIVHDLLVQRAPQNLAKNVV